MFSMFMLLPDMNKSFSGVCVHVNDNISSQNHTDKNDFVMQ